MESLPYEIWICVVNHLEDPYNFLLTSKYMFSLIKYYDNLDNRLIKKIVKNIHLENLYPEDLKIDEKYVLKKACKYGNLEVLKYLHSRGVDIRSHYSDALKLASQYGHLEVVIYLVENGCKIRARNDYAVRSASARGHLDVVIYLVERGANIRANNDYAIKWASHNGHHKVVNYLIKRGAVLGNQ